jgi:hypothetical protein
VIITGKQAPAVQQLLHCKKKRPTLSFLLGQAIKAGAKSIPCQ